MSDIQPYQTAIPLCDLARPGISYAGRERVHRVEFINWKGYTICNVEVDGTWRTCSFPTDTTVIDFLMDGSIANAHKWTQGRYYSHTQ